jgi:hypothetical protein
MVPADDPALLKAQIAALTARTEALQTRLRAANGEIARLQRCAPDGAGAAAAAEPDAQAWVASQLQRHDSEQASQQLLLTVCELLQVREPAEIVPALSSVVRGVKKLPQMDAFIGGVAAIVLDSPSRTELRSRRLQDVIPCLHRWKAERADGSIQELRAFKDSVAQTLLLLQGLDDDDGAAMDDSRLLVSQVARLVRERTEADRRELSRQGVYARAEALMHRDPSALPTQMVRHFQR